MSVESDARNAVSGIFLALIVIIIELALEPFVESMLSNVPSAFAKDILLVRLMEVFAVILSFLAPLK